MVSLLADLLGMIATWLGLGLVVMVILGLKAWGIVRAYYRAKARAPTASAGEQK